MSVVGVGRNAARVQEHEDRQRRVAGENLNEEGRINTIGCLMGGAYMTLVRGCHAACLLAHNCQL